MNQNKITKVIEILYHNKIYQIEDIYHLHMDTEIQNLLGKTAKGTHASSSISHMNHSKSNKDSANTNSSDNKNDKNEGYEKKVYIFKNINRTKGTKERSKKEKDSRNTKNIAKNFCKAFMLYIHS